MVLDPNNPQLDIEQGHFILVDKPESWTSFDVVNKIRYPLKRWSGHKRYKVGHAGTLDPFATGLLIICSGKRTKELDQFQGLPKTYSGIMRLGQITPSFDTETEVNEERSIEGIDIEKIEAAADKFRGQILQKPPMYSAIRKDGERLYNLARKGESIEVEARPIEILELKFPKYEAPDLYFELTCSKGTYVRSLARDLGEKLGCGAYLTALRREAIGEHKVSDAWQIEALAEFLNSKADNARIQRPQ